MRILAVVAIMVAVGTVMVVLDQKIWSSAHNGPRAQRVAARIVIAMLWLVFGIVLVTVSE